LLAPLLPTVIGGLLTAAFGGQGAGTSSACIGEASLRTPVDLVGAEPAGDFSAFFAVRVDFVDTCG